MSAELTRLNPTVVVILGGPGVVWPQVERALKSKVTTVARAGGVDRFGTAAITATGAFASADTALIATGSAFPDALAGGAYAATRGAPLFLVPGTCLPQYVIDELHYLAVSHVVVLGGTGVVSGAAAALTPCPAPSWLVKTNGWRADYGAGPVREDPEFSGDIAAHNFYMGKTGQYAHTEDPNNEWYTPHGALGGISADLAMTPGAGRVDGRSLPRRQPAGSVHQRCWLRLGCLLGRGDRVLGVPSGRPCERHLAQELAVSAASAHPHSARV